MFVWLYVEQCTVEHYIVIGHSCSWWCQYCETKSCESNFCVDVIIMYSSVFLMPVPVSQWSAQFQVHNKCDRGHEEHDKYLMSCIKFEGAGTSWKSAGPGRSRTDFANHWCIAPLSFDDSCYCTACFFFVYTLRCVLTLSVVCIWFCEALWLKNIKNK